MTRFISYKDSRPYTIAKKTNENEAKDIFTGRKYEIFGSNNLIGCGRPCVNLGNPVQRLLPDEKRIHKKALKVYINIKNDELNEQYQNEYIDADDATKKEKNILTIKNGKIVK